MASLISQEEDFPAWYGQIIAKAQLAENGPVKGTIVIRPYGWSIWEKVQANINERILDQGVENCYFPLFIPESYLTKEAEHIAGFAPELAVVTHGGGKELEEAVIVRPTSETLFGTYMAKWVESYRDLPLKLNQWSNVVRWELRTRLFLRTSEFLWQEGHTAHRTQIEAQEFATKILLEVYLAFFHSIGLTPLIGIKPESERFAGAINTLTCEAMMADGKALQIATSHELGQNFSRSFDISFLDENGNHEYAWTTSWGASTRILGGLIMSCGDNQGLRLPPLLAPHQVAIIPIKSDDTACIDAANTIQQALKQHNITSHIYDRHGWSFGHKV